MHKLDGSSYAGGIRPTVSVLVPTYNRAKYIKECLDSLFAQTIKPCQIIVIDDGSIDATPEILHSYSDEIIHLRKENGGKSSALNYGLKYATGEYVWLFDDDDVALPDAIERRLRVFADRTDVDYVYSGHCFGFDGDDNRIIVGNCYQPAVLDGDRLRMGLLEGCFFTQPSVLARRRCYENLEPFDERFARGQDYEMLIRMALRYRGVGIAEPTFIVRVHEGVRGPANMLHAYKDREKNWLQFEHMIGRRIREELTLSDYFPSESDVTLNDESQRRLAYLQRMLIMASKGLVEEMVSDLLDAVALAPQARLDESSLGMCRRAMMREYMQIAMRSCSALFMKQIGPLNKSRAGRDALRAMARGLFWVARQKNAERIGRGRALQLSAELLLLSLLRLDLIRR